MARAISKMSLAPHILRPAHRGSPATLPVFIYGTAWKKDRTTDLVHQAITSGFRAVDTAAQPKHYREDLVGDGIRRAIRDGTVQRHDLHIQTKFTSVQGQSPTDMPYDPSASITDQVHASIASSLHNLRPSDSSSSTNNPTSSYIDTLILHSPLPTMTQTLEAWHALESYVPQHIHHLGVSNCSLPFLRDLLARVSVSPSVIQNRFYVGTQFDVPLREFCRDNGLVYESFWTLTANPELVRSEAVQMVARNADVEVPVALYALVLGLEGTSVLNGTTRRERMRGDLEGVESVAKMAEERPEVWRVSLEEFRALTGDEVRLA